jgi:single-stranded DNA-binding protein
MSDSGTINKVILFGQVSKSPRRHKNGDGRNVLCFTLTTIETYWQNGTQVEQNEDHAIRLPESKIEQDINLGQWLHVEGKIKTTAFTDEQLVKRYKTEVIAFKVSFLGRESDYLLQRTLSQRES